MNKVPIENAFRILKHLLPTCSKWITAIELASAVGIGSVDADVGLLYLEAANLATRLDDYDGGPPRWGIFNQTGEPAAKIASAEELAAYRKERGRYSSRHGAAKRRVLHRLTRLFRADDAAVSNMHFFIYFHRDGMNTSVSHALLDAKLKEKTKLRRSTELWIGTKYARNAEERLARFVQDQHQNWTWSSAANLAFNPPRNDVVKLSELPPDAYACYEIEHDGALAGHA